MEGFECAVLSLMCTCVSQNESNPIGFVISNKQEDANFQLKINYDYDNYYYYPTLHSDQTNQNAELDYMKYWWNQYYNVVTLYTCC